MSRITKLTVDQLDPDLRRMSRADDKTPLELGLTRIFGHCPEMAKGLSAFAGSLKVNRTLPERLFRTRSFAHCISQPVPQLHGHSLHRCIERWHH
jgi:hypothetical protein